ncbi:MAG: kelch repeat-containing protein [Chthoniobacteraceae bacterium]
MKTNLLLSLCTLAVSMNLSAADWERLAPLPEPNGGFVSGVVDGRIIIAGGTNWKDDTKHWLARIHAYDPASNTWSGSGTLAAPLAYAVAGEHAAALWFAGGSGGKGTHTAVSNIDRSLGVKSAFTLTGGSALAGGALLGSSLYVLGGTDDMDHLERATNAFLAIDLRSGRSTKLPDYPEPAFFIGASAACGDRFFAFGGARWDAATKTVANLYAAHAFNTVSGRWEKLAPLPVAIRGITAVALDDTHILLAGGYKNDTEEFTDETLIYDVASDKYTATQALPYRAMVVLVKSGDWLYCLGGEDRKKHRTDAAFRIRWKELLPRN